MSYIIYNLPFEISVSLHVFCIFWISIVYVAAGIRQLQLMLLKVSLILGVEIHVSVEFTRLVGPPEEQTDDSECNTETLPHVSAFCLQDTYIMQLQLMLMVC